MDAFLNHIKENGGFYADVDDDENVEDDVLSGSIGKENSKVIFDFSNLMFNNSSNKSKTITKTTYIKQNPQNLQLFLSKLFLLSYIWSFGGHFNCLEEEAEDIDTYCHIPNFSINETVSIRSVFDLFVRNLFEYNFDMHLPPGAHLMYSYYVDFEKGQFMLWDHLVLNATLYAESEREHKIPGLSLNCTAPIDYLTPTSSTICYSFLIALLSLNGIPVLVSGPNGSW